MKPSTTELSCTVRHRVADRDTAAHWGNDLSVLATPVLLWLGETTAMRAVEGHLEDGEMTVGVSHDSAHLAPTPQGREVRISARLVERRGRRLVFEVSAYDDWELVFQGRHTRAVVRRDEFVELVRGKAETTTGVTS
ncbi:thioesterase family protein [Micromonospora sp. DT41]|uniref:thioesterase family protein n=1 Tax=Micromonospora sp. DT41 TaxID=3393437 RepID=UPI003CF9767B